MGDDDQGSIHGVTAGGVAGAHTVREALVVLAGSSTEKQFNTIQSAIVPIGCFKVESMRFNFDSSIVLSAMRLEMPLLAGLLAAHREAEGQKRRPVVSVFGHADPVGDDDYNKALSGRRAAVIYGMLARRAEVWEDLYKNTGRFAQAAKGDVWGLRAIQIMLNGLPAEQFAADTATGDNTAPGTLEEDGKEGPRTSGMVKRFQAGVKGKATGLAVDGEAGPDTRKALFLAYMDCVCFDEDVMAFQLDAKEEFLGRGADAEGKGDFQGCGEFNPVFLQSQADIDLFEKTADSAAEKPILKATRDAANELDRRVMVLLFRPGAKVSTKFWPCPKAREGVAGCRERFWSDGEKRRGRRAADKARRFEETKDTLACRFYQRLLTGSPCEKSVVDPIVVRVVPEVFSRSGNVQGRLERVDGLALPKVKEILLGTTKIPLVFAPPDGRLYFFPPRSGDDKAVSGALPSTGAVLQLEKPVSWTDDPDAGVESLERQMGVLRQCGRQVVAQGKAGGVSKEVVQSMFAMVLDDGHLRLVDSLARLQVRGGTRSGFVEVKAPAGDDAVKGLLSELQNEHGPELDQFVQANFRENV